MDFEEFVAKQLSDIAIPDEAKTVQDVFDTFTEEQKQVVYYLVGAAVQTGTEAALKGLEVYIAAVRKDLI